MQDRTVNRVVESKFRPKKLIAEPFLKSMLSFLILEEENNLQKGTVASKSQKTR